MNVFCVCVFFVLCCVTCVGCVVCVCGVCVQDFRAASFARLLVEFWWCLKRQNPQMCLRLGFTRQPATTQRQQHNTHQQTHKKNTHTHTQKTHKQKHTNKNTQTKTHKNTHTHTKTHIRRLVARTISRLVHLFRPLQFLFSTRVGDASTQTRLMSAFRVSTGLQGLGLQGLGL